MEAYLGYVMFNAGTFAPRNWALCTGQLLAISQNTALFSLLGTNYGGDGVTTFALPHLGGRVVVGTGQAPGIGHNYQLGEVSGAESTTITSGQLPQHVHALTGASVGLLAVTDNTAVNTASEPEAGARLGIGYDSSGGSAAPALYVPASVSGTTANLAGQISGSTAVAGGSQPLSIMQPYLALNAVICTQGLFPSRN